MIGDRIEALLNGRPIFPLSNNLRPNQEMRATSPTSGEIIAEVKAEVGPAINRAIAEKK